VQCRGVGVALIDDVASAENFVFASYLKARPLLRGPDERTRHPELPAQLLASLDRPERGLPCLLVAGSKGKGSTAAFAARLLAADGKRVGLFTSPHLLNVRERIRVDGWAIPSNEFVQHVKRLAQVACPLAESLPSSTYLSPIGLLLCVALLHFRARGVELAVIEAGRGARFDDTRLVEHSVAVITRLMREHTPQLGASLSRIAWHKAGAIPANGEAMSAPQPASARMVLEAEAKAQHSRLLTIGSEIELRRWPDDGIEITTARRRYSELRPGLRGPHQAENMALALAGAEALWPGLAELAPQTIQQAVADVRWPGRCQTIQEHPLVLLDGAINAGSARAFLAAALPISRCPIIAIAGAPANKDYPGLFRTLAPHVNRLYVTRAGNPHLRFPVDAAAVARRHARQVMEYPNLPAAVRPALSEVGSGGTLWIVGTQSLVGDALRLWGKDLETL
jgi:dihydrofolate synthase / folylpolyglutamate synthase